jgi:hypothetical protein
MIYVLLLFMAIAGVASLVAVDIGHSPAGDLDSFRPDMTDRPRQFAASVQQVLAAYVAGAAATPGMRVVDQAADSLLIDVRPTVRIIDGNYGMAIRISAHGDGAVTTVQTSARNKVPWAVWNHSAALRSAETVLRRNAKDQRLKELV